MSYHQYLQLEPLLSLQHTRSDEPDEHLFILIHQVYELWFKQVLHEIDHLMVFFNHQDSAKVLLALKRIRAIFKTIVAQVDILETMTPIEFASFRECLESASGFQSYQFRSLEAAFGIKNFACLKKYDDFPHIQEAVNQRLNAPTLYDGFLKLVSMHYGDIPSEILNRDFSQIYSGDERVQTLLTEIYKEDLILKLIMESLVDLDEGLQEWRYRHIKMVERTIGGKIGTGGSKGANYLKSTIFKPAFVDLWEIRNNF